MKMILGMYKRLIECYYNGARLRFHETLKRYRGLSTRQYVCGIEICQNGGYPVPCCVPVGSKDRFAIARYLNKHQQRISKEVLNAFAAKAVGFMPASSFTSTNFDKYFDYVADEAEKSGVLVNGKCLLVYDYCLITGYSSGPKPKEYVYLFRGAMEGAKTVLPPSALAGKFRVPTKMLLAALGTTCLNSMEIEDFLCVCEAPLKYLASSCAASVCPVGGCGKGSGKP